jgi:hypothetical protein
VEEVRKATPKEVLHRDTPRRRAASIASLGLAQEGKRRKREQGKSTGIQHGLSCVDLRGSLAMAGATPEELEAHRQDFLAAFAPGSETATKLVLGMADCAWRRELLPHVHAVEQAIGLEARLTVAAEPGQADLGDYAVAMLVRDVFDNGEFRERLGKLNGRFEHLGWLLLAGRDEEEGFAPKLRWNRHNRNMIEWSAAAMGNPFRSPREVAQVLAAKTGEMKPAGEWSWQGGEARKAARVERVKEQLLREYQTDVHPILRHQAEPITDLLKRGGSAVLVMDGGKTEVTLGEGEPQQVLYMTGGTAQVAAGIAPSAWPEWREKEAIEALKQEYLRTSMAQRGKATVGGVSRADLLQGFAEAFAVRESGIGSRESETDGVRDSGFGVRREDDGPCPSPDPESGTPNPDPGPSSSASPEPQIPTPDSRLPALEPGDAGRIRSAANAAWELVKVFEERTREEKEQLKAILAEAGQSARQRLERIRGLFSDVTETFLTACERLAKLQQKLCALLGGRPWAREWELARPRQGLGREGWSLGLAELTPDRSWIDPKLRQRYREDLRFLAEPEVPDRPGGPRIRYRGAPVYGFVFVK